MSGPAGAPDPGRTAPPVLDAEFVAEALGVFLRQVLRDSGCTTYVVNVDGGIDGAVAAGIASRAVGPEAVRAMHLPGPGAVPERREAARAVAGWLGLDLETVDLAPLLRDAPVPDCAGERRDRWLKALRAATLADRAAALDGLVLGTSNRSDLLLGRPPPAADCLPLGDLYRTQVADLARDLGVPPAALDEASGEAIPSDPTRGMVSYGVADAVLYYYVDSRRRPPEIIRRGIPAETVERVLARVRAGTRQRMPPPVPKLGARTLGLDLLHPRAWRGPA